ncbi:MAG: hypothetical protein OEZ58_07800 [Gammaproteobacteria bacterium]|nr:hypothetical protein [Gammaproteobacteria bacterium]
MSELKNQDAKLRKLMSEQEFIDLMDAEFQTHTFLQNDVQKQADWKEIENQLPERHQYRRWWSYASVAALIVLFVPIVLFQMGENDQSRFKGGEAISNINLYAFALQHDNSLRRLAHTVNVGDTLVLKIGATEKITAAVYVAENAKILDLRFLSEVLSPGMDQLISRQEKAYGFTVEPQHISLEICVLDATEQDQLPQTISTRNRFNENQCVKFNVN